MNENSNLTTIPAHLIVAGDRVSNISGKVVKVTINSNKTVTIATEFGVTFTRSLGEFVVLR